MLRFLICTIVVFSTGWLHTVALAGQRPNVVLIISDDQDWTDYGFMGHDVIRTPHLDKLAAESLVFHRGYVTSPLCRPSLASMVTGLYPHQHGVTGNDVHGGNNRAKLDLPVRQRFHGQPSLITSLVGAGYLAHQSGKWWEGSYADGTLRHLALTGCPLSNNIVEQSQHRETGA